MRSRIAGLVCIVGLSTAHAQSRPSDSAAVILVTADSTGTVSLGAKVAAATRAALIHRLHDAKLWVVADPESSLIGIGPPGALSNGDILELGKSWSAAMIVEISATSQPTGRVLVATRLVLRQSPPIEIDAFDAADVASAATTLAERIATDVPLRQRAIDDATRARGARRNIFFEFQVDRAARLTDASPRPRYPDELRPQGLSGAVVAQFVVDSSGHVDATTFKVLKSDEPRFANAVQKALSEMAFTPAELRGRRVSQLVQMPFQFDAAKP